MNTTRWSLRLLLAFVIILGLSMGIATPILGLYISSVILLIGATVAIFKWVDPLGRNTMNSHEDDWCAVASSELRPANFAQTSPFHFVTHGDAPSDEEVGRLLSEQFDQRVDEVYAMVNGSDDPLQEIVDAEAEELL